MQIISSSGQPSVHADTLRIDNNQQVEKILVDRVPKLIESDPFEPFTISLRGFFKVHINEKLLVIPFLVQQKCQGFCGIVLENLQELTSEGIALALGVTQIAAFAIEKEQFRDTLYSELTERQRLENQLSARLEIEKIIQQTSIHLMQLTSEKIDSGIREVLETLGKFAQVDRCYIYKIDLLRQVFRMTHEWTSQSAIPMIHNHPEFPIQDHSWWMEKLSIGEVISMANLDEIPAEAASERAMLESGCFRSMLFAPILSIDNLFGFVGFTTEENERSWPRDLVVLMTSVGGVIAHLFQRQGVEQELRLQRDFAIQIMNTMGQGLVVSDESDRFEYINPAFVDMLGYSQGELIGKTPQDILNSADLPLIRRGPCQPETGKGDVNQVRLQRKARGELFSMINAVPFNAKWIASGLDCSHYRSDRAETSRS